MMLHRNEGAYQMPMDVVSSVWCGAGVEIPLVSESASLPGWGGQHHGEQPGWPAGPPAARGQCCHFPHWTLSLREWGQQRWWPGQWWGVELVREHPGWGSSCASCTATSPTGTPPSPAWSPPPQLSQRHSGGKWVSNRILSTESALQVNAGWTL